MSEKPPADQTAPPVPPLLASEPLPAPEPATAPAPTPAPEPRSMLETPAEAIAPAPMVAPEPVPPSHDPAAAAHKAEAPPAQSLVPGAGAPLVPGQAASVGEPIQAQRVNTFFGVAAVILLILTLVVVVILAVFVLNLIKGR